MQISCYSIPMNVRNSRMTHLVRSLTLADAWCWRGAKRIHVSTAHTLLHQQQPQYVSVSVHTCPRQLRTASSTAAATRTFVYIHNEACMRKPVRTHLFCARTFFAFILTNSLNTGIFLISCSQIAYAQACFYFRSHKLSVSRHIFAFLLME